MITIGIVYSVLCGYTMTTKKRSILFTIMGVLFLLLIFSSPILAFTIPSIVGICVGTHHVIIVLPKKEG
jgi:hypothetical protein